MESTVKTIFYAAAIAVISGVTTVVVYKNYEPVKIIEKVETSLNNKHLASSKEILPITSFEAAAEMSLNAVVHIKTEAIKESYNDPLYEFFYGRRLPSQHVRASGSGVIISSDGYIVTNNHVIDDANQIEVTLNNKKTYQAEIIGTDPNTDLALLKIEDEQLPYISYGNSNELNIGEWVLAVGNPFNLTSTVTAGIVSAKGRDINILKNDPYSGATAIESFIQTDAAVNPGNSGGALVNTHGELIGINTAIQSNTGSYTGYSFAIPANIVKKVVRDLKEYGTVQRAFIGVSIRNIDDNLAEENDLESLKGVYVNGVTEGGSAAKAGIKSGDIITKIGTKAIDDLPELQEQIGQFRPGDKITVGINRNGEYLNIPLTLKNLKGNEELLTNTNTDVLKKLGAQFRELNNSELESLRLKNGIQVSELFKGKLMSVGVRKGFIITKVNQVKVQSVDELIGVLDKSTGGVLIEGVYENGRREFYGFGM